MKTIDILKNKYIEKIKEKILTYKKTQGGYVLSNPPTLWSDMILPSYRALRRARQRMRESINGAIND